MFTILNESADYWYYDIGINPIPANTKIKETYESWSQWQDQSIPSEIHESRKKGGDYNNGIAIIPGKIWRGAYKGKYLVAIDLDNKKAIEEFCRNGLEELKKQTLVEQHADPTKMHIYFIVDRKIPNKASDKTNADIHTKIKQEMIPALEVKSNGKGIMFCSSSPHQNGSNYRIIGTLKPIVFNAQEVQDRISLICEKYKIPYGTNCSSSTSNQIPIKDLFKPGTKILEGHNRHLEILRVMESLLQRNRGILPIEEIKKLAENRNQQLCNPPLDKIEFEKQWQCALKYVGKNINNNTGATGDTKNNKNDNNTHGNNDKKSTAESLVKLALENSSLFNDEYGIPHILLKINDHYEILPIDGSRFKRYLFKLYYDTCDNKIANTDAINNAIQILGANAIFEGKTIPLHLRVAWSNNEIKDTIYYDLADDKRRCIKITKGNGWKIVDNQFEVLFRRYKHQASQIDPVPYDNDNKVLDKFIDSLNIKNKNHKLLVKIWIISLLIPDIPHPMLLPYGEKGSAKSTLQKKIQLLIDPSKLNGLSLSNDKTEFIQQISHNYLCCYDNVRREPAWLSDEACRATTGGAFSKRKLYTDDEDILYQYKRILSFSGINIIFTQEDALDRSIKVELERLKDTETIPEDKIYDDLKQQIPNILGYIFDVVAKALEIKDSVNLTKLPRMADFALCGEAIARALGNEPLEFLDVYIENIGQQNIEIIEASPFADAISKFIDYEKQSWISSPTIFINHLKVFADDNNIDSIKFPKSPQAISRRLNKIKSNLREGLEIEVIVDRITSGKTNKKQLNTAIIKIRKISPISPLSPVSENDDGKAEDIKITGDNTSNEIIIPPASDDQNCAQISNDIANIGGIGGIGDKINNSLTELYANSNPLGVLK